MLNLTVKDAAIEVTEIEHFKNLMHIVYQYFKNKRRLEKIFLKKWQGVYKEKSLKFLENKDQYWLTSDTVSKII